MQRMTRKQGELERNELVLHGVVGDQLVEHSKTKAETTVACNLREGLNSNVNGEQRCDEWK